VVTELSPGISGAGLEKTTPEKLARPSWASRRILGPAQATLIVAVAGFVLTTGVTWTAWTLNRHNEHRLLEVQTHQAGAVIAGSILTISDPLTTALRIAESGGRVAGPVRSYLAGEVGANKPFVFASLWESGAVSPREVTSIGTSLALAQTPIEAIAFVQSALHARTFIVTGIPSAIPQRIGYAIADTNRPTFVIYAERAIPANRRVPVETTSAFADLNFATYLGPLRASNLTTTDLSAADLPIKGFVAKDVIPFGNSTLTLVASPRGQLGGALGGELPWIFLAGGTLLTGAMALATEQLFRRRRDALEDARTIAGLYENLDDLYGEQRTIAETLQRALLPQRNPSIPNLEIACRYVAGADGVDIGGDWYSVIEIDDRRFAFAVGDVSGRGLSAATIMARLQFYIEAYLLEGRAPGRVLEMCSDRLDIMTDGHFSTALVGIGDLETREIRLANAGHPNALIIQGDATHYVETTIGPPLGVASGPYAETSLTLPLDATLFAFTDGLIERRGENLDVGLARLSTAAAVPAASLEELVTRLLAEVGDEQARDDVAALAFRWR
jgi:serine phosphatase RsbU (regulator of sigma subunit)